MTARIPAVAVVATLLAHGCVLAQDAAAAPQPASSPDLKDYLVDIGAGPVSAADLIGVSATAVTEVQSLKDFNVLLSPGVGGGQKTGMGLQITPARTPWSPMTARQYVDSDAYRLLGSLSLSYAQNSAIYGGATYRQQGAALHLGYYLHKADDPLVAAHEAFANCDELRTIGFLITHFVQDQKAKARLANPAITQAELDKIDNSYNASPEFAKRLTEADAAVKECVADKARDKWNSAMVALTVGTAWIRPDSGGTQLPLARSLSLAAVLPDRDVGAFNLVARFNRHEVDVDSLATTPTYGSHTLVAARYTYRGPKDSDLYKLVEVSNARDSDATVASTAFKLALGVDKRVSDGVWLEFRVGRARSNNGSGDQTKALMTFKWSPTPTLPTLFAKQ
jgi:hypothetical protein